MHSNNWSSRNNPYEDINKESIKYVIINRKDKNSTFGVSLTGAKRGSSRNVRGLTIKQSKTPEKEKLEMKDKYEEDKLPPTTHNILADYFN